MLKSQYERNFIKLKPKFLELTGKKWDEDLSAYLSFINGQYLDKVLTTVLSIEGTQRLRFDMVDAKIDRLD